MEGQEPSASNLVLQQSLNQADRFKQKINKIDPYGQTNYSNGFFNGKRTSNIDFDQKSLQMDSSQKQNKKITVKLGKSNKSIKGGVKIQINDTVANEQKDSQDRTHIVFSKGDQKKLVSKSEKNIKNLDNSNYLCKLMKPIPAGKTFMGSIVRQKQFLSFSAILKQKNEQLITFTKSYDCLNCNYSIVSKNKTEKVFLGMMKSNFSGSIFNLYEQEATGKINIIATIYFKEQFSLKSKPRTVELYIKRQGERIQQDQINMGQEHNLKNLYQKTIAVEKIIKLTSKQPEISPQGNYFLRIHDESLLPSVKNTILQNEKGQQLFQFYKVGSDEFKIKAKQEVSALIGYCFGLSSLVFKLASQ